MRRRVSTLTIAGVVTLVLLVVAAAARPGPGTATVALWSTWQAEIPAGSAGGQATTQSDLSWFAPVGQLLAAVVLVGLIIVLGRRLVVHLVANRAMGPPWRPRVAPAGGRVRFAGEDAEYAGALAEAADIGARSMADATRAGQPYAVSDAVIAAWVRLERVAAEAGVERRRRDTAVEFAHDLLARGLVSAPALDELVELYGRARFSDEYLGADDAHQAQRALVDIRRELTSHQVAPR